MHPIILKIEHITLYSYGVMLSIGFLVAIFLAIHYARRAGFSPNLVIDLALWSIIWGIVGARFLYVLLNFDYYAKYPIEIVMLNKGGLVFYGGILTGIGGGTWFLKRKGLKFGPLSDIIIPYIPLGQAFGRIGCYLNGCCYGKVTSHKIGVVFLPESIAGDVHPYQPLIPIQLYSALTLVGIFLLLKFFQEKKFFPGDMLIVYGIIYSFARFIIEFFRGDNPAILLGLTVSQIISVVSFSVCIVFLLWKSLISRHHLITQARG